MKVIPLLSFYYELELNKNERNKNLFYYKTIKKIVLTEGKIH